LRVSLNSLGLNRKPQNFNAISEQPTLHDLLQAER
jgi:hypothetical protein